MTIRVKKTNKRLFIRAVVIIIILFAGIRWFTYRLMAEVRRVHCNGIVLYMKDDTSAFMPITVKEGQDTITFEVSTDASDKTFFRFTHVGDSITKEEGSLTLTVIHKNGESKEFDYPWVFE